MTWFRGLAKFAVAIVLVLGLCVIGVDAQKKKKRTRRTTKAAAPKPVITNPAIAPATTTDANGDIKIISTADQTSSEAEEPGATKKPKSDAAPESKDDINKTINTLSNQVNKLTDRLRAGILYFKQTFLKLR